MSLDYLRRQQEELEKLKRFREDMARNVPVPNKPPSQPVTFKDLPKEMQDYLNNQTKQPYRDPNKPNPAITEVLSGTPTMPQYPPNTTNPPIAGSGIDSDYTWLILLGAVAVGILIIK